MGGLFKVVARLEEDIIISKVCIASTYLNLCLKQENFINIINEIIDVYDVYDINKIKDLKNKEPISPVGEGIVFYDYKNKKAFSFQNYCKTLEFSMLDLFNDYAFKNWINGKITKIDSKNNFASEECLKNIELFKELKEKKCLFNIFNNERLVLENIDVLSAFRSLCDKTIFTNGMVSYYIKDEYFNIKVEYPEWEFYSDRSSNYNIKFLRKYLEKENLLDKVSQEEWDEFLLQ